MFVYFLSVKLVNVKHVLLFKQILKQLLSILFIAEFMNIVNKSVI